MSDSLGLATGDFVVTKEYRRFSEFCDACRRSRYIGLGYGPPGTGKTESARYYAHWNQVEPLLPEPLITFAGRGVVGGLFPYKPFTFSSAPDKAPLLSCRTVFYTPPVSASPGRLEREVLTLFAAFSYLVEAANQRQQGKDDFLVTRRFSQLIEFLIIDEANRLKDAGLEQIRDLCDRGCFGVILLGMRRLLRSGWHARRSSIRGLVLRIRWTRKPRGGDPLFSGAALESSGEGTVGGFYRPGGSGRYSAHHEREYALNSASHAAGGAHFSRQPARGS